MKNKEFNEKWITAFCKCLTEEQRNKVGVDCEDGFLWHAFSYGYVPCFKGNDAKLAYDNANKSGAMQAFYELNMGNMQYSIGDVVPISKEYLTAVQIDNSEDVEVYIIGKDYKWCYVRTHEDAFGPYFCFSE